MGVLEQSRRRMRWEKGGSGGGGRIFIYIFLIYLNLFFFVFFGKLTYGYYYIGTLSKRPFKVGLFMVTYDYNAKNVRLL